MSKEQQLADFIAELGIPRDLVTPDYDLIANRLIDSLGLLQIVAFMESEFGIEVLDEELTPEHFSTVKGMVSLVESKESSSESAAGARGDA